MPIDLAARIDAACNRFEEDWKAGKQPRIEDVLAGVVEAERAAFLRPLLERELELTAQTGAAPGATAYVERFPDHADLVWSVFEGRTQTLGQVTLPPAVTLAHTPSGLDGSPEKHLGRRVGAYRLMRLLGSGGMGSVFLAERVDDFRQQVALKVMKGAFPDEDTVQRFRAERQILAGLNHPHIARLLDGGTTPEGSPYLVMEYVPGEPLDRYCQQREISLPERVRLLRTACQAVQYAHAQGVIHRDLKPGNVLVSGEGVVKVLDFGLAKQIRPGAEGVGQTSTGVILGTPCYMAPEQAAGKIRAVGPAADVYSLGAILYELLTGRPPFLADSSFDTVLLVINEEPVPPRRLNPRLPVDLETLCLKCLEKDPARRYASPQSLAEELGRFLNGEPIQARPISKAERCWRWCRRYPLVATLMGLIFLLLLGGLIGAIWAAVGFRQAADQERKLSETVAQTNLQLEKALYTQSIAVAERELSLRQDVARAEELLNSCPEKLRGWEWHHLRRLLDGPVPILSGHGGGVWSVAFSPKNQLLASGGIDGSVRLWDPDTNQQVQEIAGSALYPVVTVAFAPDGTRLAAGGISPNFFNIFVPSGVVKIHDTDSGKLLHTYEGHSGLVVAVTFTPDGTEVVSAGFGNEIHVWNAATGKLRLRLTGHLDWINRLAFSPDGKLLASGAMDGTVRLWDLAAGKQVVLLDSKSGPVRDLAFHPIGKQLASAVMDGTIRLWDLQTNTEQDPIKGHAGSVLCLAYHPDGKRLASGGYDRTIKVWDLEEKKAAITLRGHTDSIWSLAFSTDGHRLASASFDKTVRLWDAGPLPAFAPQFQGHRDRVNVVQFSPDGKTLASSSWDQTVRLWDAATGKERHVLKGHTGSVWGLAFDPTGERLVSVSWDRTVKIWDLASGTPLRTLRGHTAGVHSVAFHPEGQLLASGCLDGEIRLWDSVSGKEVRKPLRGHFNLVYALAFSPDGQLLASGSGDRKVQLWDLKTGKPRRTLSGHEAVVHGLAFHPDGKTLASASWDKTVRLWHIEEEKPPRILKGHTDRIHAVAFSRDGTELFSAGEDHTLRQWEVSSGWEVGAPRYHRGVVWSLSAHPKAARTAAACWYPAEGIRLWDGKGIKK